MLLILNTASDFVREKLINGFQRLIRSFKAESSKYTFEVRK